MFKSFKRFNTFKSLMRPQAGAASELSPRLRGKIKMGAAPVAIDPHSNSPPWAGENSDSNHALDPNSTCASRTFHRWLRYFGVAAGLVDDQLQAVFRHGAVAVEQHSQCVVGGVGEFAFDLAPGDQRAGRLVAVVADEAIRFYRRFDGAAYLLRLLLNFAQMGAETEVGKIE